MIINYNKYTCKNHHFCKIIIGINQGSVLLEGSYEANQIFQHTHRPKTTKTATIFFYLICEGCYPFRPSSLFLINETPKLPTEPQ